MPAPIRVPDYTASQRQSKFHTSSADETLYGGAAGGGKTAALSAEAITSALEASGTFVYVFRRTLKELRQSVYQEIMKQLAPYLSVPDTKQPVKISYNAQESQFKFSNGSVIQLAYLDTVADRYRYQSAEIHVLLIDELTHFLQDDYEYLKTRVRSTDNRRTRIMAATNPGGVGHGWVLDYFVDIKDENGDTVNQQPEILYEAPSGLSRIFIPAKVSDHPIESFKISYTRTLNAISDPQLRAALLDGDWHTFQGQVFREWRPSKHVLSREEFLETVDLTECRKFVGFDWGWRDPAVASWIALSSGGKLYLYREIHQTETTPEDWARQIKEIIDEEPIQWMALPHDAYNHHLGDKTIAEVLSKAHIPVRPVHSLQRGARMNRQALLHQLFADDLDGTPTLRVHEQCKHFIRTVPYLTYSDTIPEEIDSNADDHDYDAATYALSLLHASGALIINPKAPERQLKAPVSYNVDEHGNMPEYHYDIGNALKPKDRSRDWRYG